jgi:CubicO group peptidase (beta-lactamase class C family)
MEQIIQSFVASKQFMGTVLVASEDEIILDKGYGFADLEWGIPNSSKTKFRLGSLTKQFTAAAILLLGERGQLDVRDSVMKFVPEAPSEWNAITLFHLLTHTSGIPNFTAFADYASLKHLPATPEQLVERFRDKPLEFQPGEKWSYSNSGYVLLGHLIERICGQSYAQFVEQNLFKPLSMVHSGYDSNSAIIQNRASGYVPDPSGPLNAEYIHMTIPLSAGGLYSTTWDLLRWERALFSGKVLSSVALEQMITPFKDAYAFGLRVRNENGQEVIEHGGGIEGFNAMLAYYPKSKLTVIVLGNVSGSAPQEIADYLGVLALDGNVVLASERERIHVDPRTLARYVGAYQLDPNFSIEITQQEHRLFGQASGQPQFEIFAETDKEYFLKAFGARITFVTGKQGWATELILHQRGIHRRAKRVE